jgi:2-oxoglutarate dehydrogenase E2 component (dihydrolipoamide succinyltransferase)
MSSFVDVTLPEDQAEGTETVVAAWFKAVGDPVMVNEPLLEVSTDKVTVEIPSPATGVLREILKSDGDEVEPGEVLGRIALGELMPSGDEPVVAGSPEPKTTAAAPSASTETDDRSSELSPSVRRMIKEHGLDVGKISGTGRGGRITADDVEAYLAWVGSAMPSHRVKHSTMRKSIAQHMSDSVQAAPHVTSVFEADLSAIQADRAGKKAEFESQGARLTLTAYFVRATVEAIRAVPESNARWHDDALEVWDTINVGIATALDDGGLIVPVVKEAQDLDLLETARRVQDLTERARAGTLSPTDVRHGTFTISNHGVSGSLVATPIVINQPQSAILGVGKLEQRPVVRDGSIVARPMAYVTLTIDHRVLDGHSANRFLSRWVEAVEGWPAA